VIRNWTIAFLLIAVASTGAAQDLLPFTADTPDTKYFDFWPGVWRSVVDGRVEPDGTTFRVRRDVHKSAFVEEWTMKIGETRMRATALRAWDKTAGRWMFTWVSDNGLYQVWEGRKVGDDWYIYREFDIAGDRYLSRQAWIPKGPNKLTRISERSDDGGKTWKLRFKQEFQRE